MTFKRNNLDKEPSPYLKQYQNSPINWQPWNSDTLDFIKTHSKLVFVSIGYSTCHWCHIMANDTFNNISIANFLNENFISIQVDKEQRPDIDSYYIEFINRVLGRGGWPLNVVLSPDLKPIFAGTYFPSYSEFNLPSFSNILEEVYWWYQKNKKNISDFHPYTDIKDIVIEDERVVIEPIVELFDKKYGGFGEQTKFPPYNTLLFLFSYYEDHRDNKKIKNIIKKTLDFMQLRGLHDHLQGGFFRYTSDRGWAIPHFEKMLYDQAMMLWVYSLGYKTFKDESYRNTAKKIIKCLVETFEEDDGYITGYDAGIDNIIGVYYLWSVSELSQFLSLDQSKQFYDVYELYSTEMLLGKNHLVKKKYIDIPEIEEKLLNIRKKRYLPFLDRKILTNWNALTAISFIMAYRYASIDEARDKAINLYQRLIKRHIVDGKLTHGMYENQPQKDVFISDYAALLLLATYIYEENQSNLSDISFLYDKLLKFKINGQWYKNVFVDDFFIIPSDSLDYPIPSDVSLSEFAAFRSQLILSLSDSLKSNYKVPLQNDFYNLFSYLKNGNYHQIYSPDYLDWRLLPINSIQINNHKIEDSFRYQRKKFQNHSQLMDYLKNFGFASGQT
jgi:uncharacterized protein YyaL (SSP411 family)